ncbi:hypothetical protein WJX84_005784, partial [Apatococcus fuscideae]
MTVADTFRGLYWEIRFLSERRSISWSRKVQLAVLKSVTAFSYEAGRRAALKQPRALARKGTHLTIKTDTPRPVNSNAGSEGSADDRGPVHADITESCVAVIVPVFIKNPKEAALVKKLLLWLSKQDRPAENIILVDDASPIPVKDFLGSNTSSTTSIISIFR